MGPLSRRVVNVTLGVCRGVWVFCTIFLFGADFDLRLKDSFIAVFGVFGGYERRRAQSNRPPSGQMPGLWPCWKYRASATGTADKFLSAECNLSIFDLFF